MERPNECDDDLCSVSFSNAGENVECNWEGRIASYLDVLCKTVVDGDILEVSIDGLHNASKHVVKVIF